MPIKGISDRYRMPILGTIHIGEKGIKHGKEYPKKLDYFRFPEGLEHPFGERPKEIEIIFPSNDLEWCCSIWYKRWGGAKDPKDATLLCRGDGETATETDPQTGKMSEIECLGAECEHYLAEKCIQQCWLKFLLPTVPGLGVWQIYSKGYHTMVNVNSMLTTFVNTGRPFAGIKFTLGVRIQKKIVEGPTGKAIKRVFPVLYIVQNDLSFAQLTAGASQRCLLAPETLGGMQEARPDDLVAKRNRSGDNGDPEPDPNPIDTTAVEVAEEETKAKAEVAEKKVKAATARPAKRTSLF